MVYPKRIVDTSTESTLVAIFEKMIIFWARSNVMISVNFLPFSWGAANLGNYEIGYLKSGHLKTIHIFRDWH